MAHVRDAPRSVRFVSAADKLYNARCIVADYRLIGDDLWSRFTGGRDGTLWYYRAVCDALDVASDPRQHALVAELDRTVRELEGLIDGSRLDGRG